MALDLDDLGDDVLQFLTDRHLASLTVLRANGTPHVAPVGFTYDPAARLARIITWEGAHKVRHVEASGRGAVCQIDGGRWLTLEGSIRVVREPEAVAIAVAAYGERYSPAKDRDDRVALEISVERMMGRA